MPLAEEVRSYFDLGAPQRRLLPLRKHPDDLGAWHKYVAAVELILAPEVKNVLDIGCGVGSVEALLQKTDPDRAAEISINGIDVSGRFIAPAKSLQLANCIFSLYDGLTLP